ncbi:MAG: DMT family transporter [Asticcacaulis sp.]|uniref:DMT family transporter n=1 Tax=Asticcacaulis sp. TaxID=1872648 RepID=UPI0039E57D10
MSTSSTVLGFGVLMFFAGIGIPIMAALNGGLGARLASPAAASLILFCLAATISAIVLTFTGWPQKPFAGIPPQYFTGGLFVAFYALSITWAGPRIGVGNAVMLVLLGQLAAAAAIDHFGLLGAVRSPITVQRALGIAAMVVGVFLARKV